MFAAVASILSQLGKSLQISLAVKVLCGSHINYEVAGAFSVSFQVIVCHGEHKVETRSDADVCYGIVTLYES